MASRNDAPATFVESHTISGQPRAAREEEYGVTEKTPNENRTRSTWANARSALARGWSISTFLIHGSVSYLREVAKKQRREGEKERRREEEKKRTNQRPTPPPRSSSSDRCDGDSSARPPTESHALERGPDPIRGTCAPPRPAREGSAAASARHVMACTVLYCTVLHCTVLYCTVLYFNVT